MNRLLQPVLLAGLLLAACGDSTSGSVDATTLIDTASADTAAVDDVPTDDDVAVADADDAGPDDADASADDGSADADDASSCQYLDDRKLVKCHQVWTAVLYWSDWGDPECPTRWQLGTDSVDTVEALASRFQCDVDCILSASIAVDFIDCDGHRNGYEQYAGPDGCEVAFGTSNGIYTDLCQWPSYTCYCEQ